MRVEARRATEVTGSGAVAPLRMAEGVQRRIRPQIRRLSSSGAA